MFESSRLMYKMNRGVLNSLAQVFKNFAGNSSASAAAFVAIFFYCFLHGCGYDIQVSFTVCIIVREEKVAW